MSQYIEDFKGGIVIDPVYHTSAVSGSMGSPLSYVHSQKGEKMNQLSGQDLYVVTLTKLWLSAAVAIALMITTAVTTYSIVDRRQTGHAIVTTTTQQTVNYPGGK
jgi:hypothetical protein